MGCRATKLSNVAWECTSQDGELTIDSWEVHSQATGHRPDAGGKE